MMYWRTKYLVAWCFSKENDIKKATHVVVHGVQGNQDLCKLSSMKTGSEAGESVTWFTYRFLKFYYSESGFLPLTYNTDKSGAQIRQAKT
jgi:hypothetical protein